MSFELLPLGNTVWSIILHKNFVFFADIDCNKVKLLMLKQLWNTQNPFEVNLTIVGVITTLEKLALVCDNPIQASTRLSQPYLQSCRILTPTKVRFTSKGF
jgi:hypothetical protein